MRLEKTRVPGLKISEQGIYYIERQIDGRRFRFSTGIDKANFKEAKDYLTHWAEQERRARLFGLRPKVTFRDAAAEFLIREQGRKSLHTDAGRLAHVVKYIGDMDIKDIRQDSQGVQDLIADKRKQGLKNRSLNGFLEIIRRVLKKCAEDYHHDSGLSWLDTVPVFKMYPLTDARVPQPISWEDQDKLLPKLPKHLARMAEFVLHTGLRDGEVCGLRLEWMQETPIGTVFVIPGKVTKNGDDKLVVLNSVAQRIIDEAESQDGIHVFTFRCCRLRSMLNSGWKEARKEAGMPGLRVHDLRHTFAHRLREAGVSMEDRAELLGHRNGSMTTHYSAVTLQHLREVVERIVTRKETDCVLTLRKNQ